MTQQREQDLQEEIESASLVRLREIGAELQLDSSGWDRRNRAKRAIQRHLSAQSASPTLSADDPAPEGNAPEEAQVTTGTQPEEAATTVKMNGFEGLAAHRDEFPERPANPAIEAIERDLQTTRNTLASANRASARYRTQAEEAEKRVKELESELKTANDHFGEAEIEIERLKEVDERNTALQTQVDTLTTEKAALVLKGKALESGLGNAQAEINDLQQQLEEAKEMIMTAPAADWTCPACNRTYPDVMDKCPVDNTDKPAPAPTAAPAASTPAIDINAIVQQAAIQAAQETAAALQPAIDAANTRAQQAEEARAAAEAELTKLRLAEQLGRDEEANQQAQQQITGSLRARVSSDAKTATRRVVAPQTMTKEEAQIELIESGQTPSEVRRMDDATLADKVSDLLGTIVTIQDQVATQQPPPGQETHTEIHTHTDEHGHGHTETTHTEGPRQSLARQLWEKGKKR